MNPSLHTLDDPSQDLGEWFEGLVGSHSEGYDYVKFNFITGDGSEWLKSVTLVEDLPYILEVTPAVIMKSVLEVRFVEHEQSLTGEDPQVEKTFESEKAWMDKFLELWPTKASYQAWRDALWSQVTQVRVSFHKGPMPYEAACPH